MSGLTLTITTAGRAALVNATNTGTHAVLMASVGVSATSFTPSPATTSLPGEIKRISTLAGEAVADDTVHVTVRDESNAVYTVRSFGLYLADGTLFAVYSQPNPIMEKSAQAMLLLAIDVVFADIDATQITFGDTSFLNPPATTTRQGVVELATDPETTAGSDATRAVTPRGLKAAVTSWLNARFGEGVPSAFIKGLLTSASAAALRTSLGLKSAALKDEGAGKGLNADLLDGQHGNYYTNIAARLGYTPANRAGDTFTGDIGLAKGFYLRVRTVSDANTRLLGLNPSTNILYFGGIDQPIGDIHFVNNGAVSAQLTGAGATAALRVAGHLVWHAGNDGSGSGADSDTVDGLHAHQLMRADQTAETFGIYRVAAIDDFNEVPRGDPRALIPFHTNYQAANRPGLNFFGGIDMGARADYRWQFGVAIPSVTAQFWGRQQSAGTWQDWVLFWHSGNDGSGSGADADLLDGQHGSYYANIPARLGYTPANRAGDAFTGAISVPLGSSFNFGSGVALSKTTNGGILFLRSGTTSLILQNAAGSANNLTVDNATGNVSTRGKITSGGHVEVPDGSAFVSNGKAVLREAGGGTWFYSAGANGYTFRNAANTATLASITDEGRANFAGLLRGNNTVWDAGNDGSGSGADADLLDGLHAADFAKLADFVASKTTNGYCRLPNGMILQAGRFSAINDSTVTVTFPIAFPGMCMGVVVSGTAHLKADAQDNNPAVRNGSVTLTSFQVFNAADTTQAFFIAFGY